MNKRVEASFETEVIPSTVPTSLLPTSFVLPPPSPESRLPPAPQAQPSSTHPTSFLTSLPSSVPPLLFPSTTPPFSPPVQQSTPWPPHISTAATSAETRKITVPCVPPIPTAAGTNDSESHHSPPPLTLSRPFPLAKPLARNMSHAYSPVKPSPLSRILMLAASPENAAAAAAAVADAEPRIASTAALVLDRNAQDPHLRPGTNAFVSGITSAPVFERPQPPPVVASMALVPVTITQAAPAPLRTDTTSNTAGPQRRRSSTRKRTSLEAELDLDADTDANGDPRPTCKNRSDAATTVTKDPRAPEKENTIRRRLRQGPAAGRNANANATVNAANANAGRGGVKTRKMAAAAAAATTTTKAESAKPALALALAPAATTVSDHDHEPATEAGRMGGAAGRLLAAARGSTGAGGPRRVPIDSTEAAAGVGVQARRVS
jgi:hypothetical protein